MALVVDLLFWYVSMGSLLTLAWSASCLLYLGARAAFRILFLPPPPVHFGRVPARESVHNFRSPLALPGMMFAAVGRRMRVRREAARTAAVAGPWGPIDDHLSPEISQKVERVIAIGAGMYDVAGKRRPHPIAPRVALAIVEALHERRPVLHSLEGGRRLESSAHARSRL
jgi:hypothetical protein